MELGVSKYLNAITWMCNITLLTAQSSTKGDSIFEEISAYYRYISELHHESTPLGLGLGSI